MQYQLVMADDWVEFDNRMIEAIREGWKPQGGVSVTHYESVIRGFPEDGFPDRKETQFRYAQAMVKR